MSKRPEYQNPPELYYDEDQAKKYTSNSRIMEVQEQLSQRALELLNLGDNKACFLLDLGCGSSLSGEVLSEQGHIWVGVDISRHMLQVGQDRETEGDLILGDMGDGLPFRPGSFDGVISISALQWLCNADKRYHHPPKRLYKLFSTLYACMTRGARAVFQLYPENSAQMELITQQAMKAGFGGGLVIDYPNSTKAKKMFLCLFAGGRSQALPPALGSSETSHRQAVFEERRERTKAARGKPLKKSRDWILEKKERRRKQGHDVRPDSKYTGRKRQRAF